MTDPARALWPSRKTPIVLTLIRGEDRVRILLLEGAFGPELLVEGRPMSDADDSATVAIGKADDYAEITVRVERT